MYNFGELSHCFFIYLHTFPCPEPMYTSCSSVNWNATGMTQVEPVYTGIPLGDPANICRVHWNTTGETVPHWNATGETDYCSLRWGTNAYRCYSSNVWVLQHHFVHALDISAIIVFCVFGVAVQRNQLSSNNSCHTSCIHKRLHAGLVTWPNHPANQTLSVPWDTGGQTTLEPRWLLLVPRGVPVAI